MADDTVYQSSPGGGYQSGTTAGQTGSEHMDDDDISQLDMPTREEVQEEAEERYEPNPELPQAMTERVSQDGPFDGLVTEPDHHSLEGTPTVMHAAVIHNPDLPMSRQDEQAVADAAMASESEDTFEANDSDQPSQEVS